MLKHPVYALLILLLQPAPLIATNNNIIDLGLTEKQLGYRNKQLLIPLTLESVPVQPILEMRFKVIEASVCPDTYTPTELYVNGTLLGEISFIEFDNNDERSVKMEIPSELLNVGENTIRINSGSCEKAIDVMQFNSIKIHQ